MNIQVIVGSTRPGRVTDRLAKRAVSELNQIGEINASLVDLVEYPLPFFDEQISPQYNPNRQPSPGVKKFVDKLSEADGFVIVSPEYNRTVSGVLKNALDYIDFQFAKKPVALVAHGSTGGAQAVGHLRGMISGLQAVTTPKATYVSARLGEVLNEDGSSVDGGEIGGLKDTLEELVWYGNALSLARKEQ